MQWKKILLGLLLGLGLVSCDVKKAKKKEVKVEVPVVKKESKALDSSLIVKIDTFISNRSKDNDLSGAFLFAKEGKVYANAFGKARYLDGDDVDVKDVFQLASVSKLVTAICILKLIENRTIQLSDTIDRIIPDFNYRNITIHQLLTHSSGLPEYMYFTDNAWSGDYSTKCNLDAFHVLNESGEPAYFNPGKRFNYRNSNYMLLAYIAEYKTGLSFAKIVEKYIKKPLGLDSLHVYQRDKRNIEQYPVWGMRGDHSFIPDHSLNHICGDKSIYANVFDLYKIYKGLVGGKLLNDASMELLFTPHIQVKKVHPQFYCYGLRQTKVNHKDTWYFHNGWWHGFRSYFWFNPEKDQCAILLTNRLKGGFLNTKDMVLLLDE